MNNDNRSQVTLQVPISQGLQVLIKEFWALYKQCDHSDVSVIWFKDSQRF